MDHSSIRAIVLLALASTAPTTAVPSGQTQESLKTLARERGGTYSLMSNTELPAASLEQVVDSADLIVQGRILTKRAELSPDELYVRTVYALQPLRVFKDKRNLTVATVPGATPPILFFEPGGVAHIDGLTISFRSDIAAQPALNVGEEVIVCLTSQGAGEPLHLSFGPYGLLRVAGSKVSVASKRVAQSRPLKNDGLADLQEEIQRVIAGSSRK
jgi:hypothetical protein